MGFLVDTSIWIAVERGKLAVGDLHAITKQFPVFVSPVNIAELTFGIALMDDVSKQLKAKSLVKRLSKKPLLKITAETGEVCEKASSNPAGIASNQSIKRKSWSTSSCVWFCS